jgi:hypothetical protein
MNEDENDGIRKAMQRLAKKRIKAERANVLFRGSDAIN